MFLRSIPECSSNLRVRALITSEHECFTLRNAFFSNFVPFLARATASQSAKKRREDARALAILRPQRALAKTEGISRGDALQRLFQDEPQLRCVLGQGVGGAVELVPLLLRDRELLREVLELGGEDAGGILEPMCLTVFKTFCYFLANDFCK